MLPVTRTGLQPPLEVDWEAYKDIYNILNQLKKNPGFKYIDVQWCQNDLVEYLAKQGRTKG